MSVSVVAAVLFLVLSTIGIILYPGGSIFSPTSEHFSLYTNFFSDLGAGGYSGQPVPLVVNILFYIAVAAAAIGFASFFTQFGKESKFAKLFGWLSALSIAALPFLPADQFLWPHRIVAVSIVTFLLIACWSLYASIKISSIRRQTLFMYSILLSAYVGWLFLGPLPDASLAANILHAVGQKIAVYGFIVVVFVFARHIKVGKSNS